MKRFIFAAVVILSWSGGARAQWAARVEEDILTDGKTGTLTGLISLQQAIYVTCSTGGDLSFAYLEKGDWDDAMSIVPMKIAVKIDDGEKVWLDARAYHHNDQYFGIKSTDEKLIKKILSGLSTGRRKLLFGLKSDVGDVSVSGSMGLSGSTSATRKFVSGCKLDLTPDIED